MMSDDVNQRFLKDFLSSPSEFAGQGLLLRNYAGDDGRGEAMDWLLTFLQQKNCPHDLAVHLAKHVANELTAAKVCQQTSDNLSQSSSSHETALNILYQFCGNLHSHPDSLAMAPKNLRFTSSEFAIRNKRRKMEDRHVVIHDLNTLLNLENVPEQSYFAIFDGHAGIDAASFASAYLHLNLAKHPSLLSDTLEAFRETYLLTDEQFCQWAKQENMKSGCTAVSALIRENKLYLAWLGDSQAVLIKQGKAVTIMEPHKANRKDEIDRIEKLGGGVYHVGGVWRVNGTLAVSRALGDYEFKPYVSSEPDVNEITLDGTEDFLLLACDGLWDVLSNEDVASAVYTHLAESTMDNSVDKLAELLVEHSRQLGSDDNISVVVVALRNGADILSDAKNYAKINQVINGKSDAYQNSSLQYGDGGFPTGIENHAHQRPTDLGDVSSFPSLNYESSSGDATIYASALPPEATALSELPTPPIDDIVGIKQSSQVSSEEQLKQFQTHLMQTGLQESGFDDIGVENIDELERQTSLNNLQGTEMTPEEVVTIASSVVTNTIETAVKQVDSTPTDAASSKPPLTPQKLNPNAEPFVMKNFNPLEPVFIAEPAVECPFDTEQASNLSPEDCKQEDLVDVKTHGQDTSNVAGKEKVQPQCLGEFISDVMSNPFESVASGDIQETVLPVHLITETLETFHITSPMVASNSKECPESLQKEAIDSLPCDATNPVLTSEQEKNMHIEVHEIICSREEVISNENEPITDQPSIVAQEIILQQLVSSFSPVAQGVVENSQNEDLVSFASEVAGPISTDTQETDINVSTEDTGPGPVSIDIEETISNVITEEIVSSQKETFTSKEIAMVSEIVAQEIIVPSADQNEKIQETLSTLIQESAVSNSEQKEPVQEILTGNTLDAGSDIQVENRLLNLHSELDALLPSLIPSSIHQGVAHDETTPMVVDPLSLKDVQNELLETSEIHPAEDLQPVAIAVDLQAVPDGVPEAEGVSEDIDSDSEKDGGWCYIKADNAVSDVPQKTEALKAKEKAAKGEKPSNKVAASQLKARKDISKPVKDLAAKMKPPVMATDKVRKPTIEKKDSKAGAPSRAPTLKPAQASSTLAKPKAPLTKTSSKPPTSTTSTLTGKATSSTLGKTSSPRPTSKLIVPSASSKTTQSKQQSSPLTGATRPTMRNATTPTTLRSAPTLKRPTASAPPQKPAPTSRPPSAFAASKTVSKPASEAPQVKAQVPRRPLPTAATTKKPLDAKEAKDNANKRLAASKPLPSTTRTFMTASSRTTVPGKTENANAKIPPAQRVTNAKAKLGNKLAPNGVKKDVAPMTKGASKASTTMKPGLKTQTNAKEVKKPDLSAKEKADLNAEEKEKFCSEDQCTEEKSKLKVDESHAVDNGTELKQPMDMDFLTPAPLINEANDQQSSAVTML